MFIHACSTSPLQKLTPNDPVLTHHQGIDNGKKVLVINSNQSIERYQVAETNYVNTLNGVNTHTVNLETESEPIEYLQDVLNRHDYDVIYCIGAKALGSIGFIDPDVPVVYSAVLNWRKFQQREHYYGIASELSPQVQLTWLKYFFLEMKNIGVFYSEENQALIDDANHAANNLSLNLKAIKLSRDDQLMLSAETLLSEVDVLWLISDSSALSSIENITALFKMADKLKVPVITYNPVFMDMGAMMSLVADLPTTARQAAILTTKLIEKSELKDSIQFPAGSRIILNNGRVNEYKIKLNPGYLDSVDELR
tara:strand:- start:10213 stop:11142 length:930 start_codon:yes stop_codon:yes gene_type:complete